MTQLQCKLYCTPVYPVRSHCISAGLDNLHLMTNNKLYELQVDLEDFDGQKASAVYKVFIVGPETNGYVLRVGNFVNYGAGERSDECGCEFVSNMSACV